ncbi:MAG: peptidylprolyl isomerase [Hyphomonadaceae bacterium]
MKHNLIRSVPEVTEASAFSGCGHGPAPVAKRGANAPPVFVNGIHIEETAIAAEAQNHAASTGSEARAAAARALAIRELLLQRARTLALEPAARRDAQGREETWEEALVRQVLEREVAAPKQPTAEECLRVYESSKDAFRTPELYESSHILCAPVSDDEEAWAAARDKAQQLLAAIVRGEDFAECARQHSDCPTAAEGGRLGQLTPGDLAPELERVMLSLHEHEVAPAPVRSRHGWHLLRLERRAPSRLMPFEAVEAAIRARLHERLTVAASARYVAGLANEAEIEGLTLSFGAS